MDTGELNSIQRIAAVGGRIARYLPEPAATGVGMFRDVMRAVRTLSDEAIGGVDPAPVGDFAELIQLQLEAQAEMQTTTMVSNVEKSKHESKMSAIRNIRVA